MNKQLDILRYGINCEGIAEDDGKIVFVPFSIEKEVCNCEITTQKSKFCQAKVLSVIKASENRVSSVCPYFEKCGGCQVMHIDYEKGLEIKSQIVKQNLSKIGGVCVNVEKCIASPKQFGYRNKVVFAISQNAKVGFFENHSHNVVEVQKCMVIDDKINQFVELFNDTLFAYKHKIYDWINQKGIIKNIEIRYYNNEYSFIIVQTQKDKSFANDLLKKLKNKDIKFSLYISVNNKNNSLIYGELYFVGGEQNLSFRPFGFIQINNDIKKLIYEKIIETTKGNVVVDAYAGAGVLSSQVCKKAKKVYAIEISSQSCEDAEDLKKQQKIDNFFIKNGDCSEVLPIILQNEQVDCVILDPPRKGCDSKVIEQILKYLPNQIIYLSCDCATLARDLKMLNGENKYDILLVQPYDMFAWSSEIETLVILEKK